MALVLIEGFDHYAAANYAAKGWAGTSPATAAGRFSGLACNTAGVFIQKALPASYSTIYGGFACQQNASLGSTWDVYNLQVGTTATMRIGINATGQWIVRNSGGTVIATGTSTLISGAWVYVEFKLVIAGAAGSIELRLNGSAGEIATTTGNFGSTNVDTVSLNRGAVSGPAPKFDDMYLLDATGAAPRNTFLGDVRVSTIYPNADGAHSQWTPSTGTTHNTLVNETAPDGDTSYVSDATPGDLDTYAFSDIDGGATVLGVQTNLYARKDDAATRQIAPVIRQAGADNVGATVTLGSSYAYFTQLYQQDPTATDWTAAVVNADEFGVKTIA